MVRLFHNDPNKKLIKQEGDLLGRIGELLNEGFTFHESIMILLPHHTDELHKAQTVAEETFRSGKGTTDVLEALGINRRQLLPIAIAEEHGRLAQAVQVVAMHYKRRQEMKEKVNKLMTYPIVLFVFTALLFFMFRTFFLPNLQLLGEGRSQERAGDITKLSALLLKVPDMMIFFVLFIALLLYGFWKWINLKTGEERLKLFLMIPGISTWYRMHLTSLFAREIGTMLQTGMSLQDAIDLLRKQDGHTSLQVVTESVRRKIVEGESLSKAVHKGAFVPDFSSFVEHGEYGGHLGKEMTIYSQLLEDKMEQKSMRLLGILQPLLFSILAICILAAYLAILLPMYELLNTI